MKASDWLLGAILLIAGVAIVVNAQGMPDAAGQLYGGGFFSTLVGAGFVVIGALLGLRGIAAGGPALRFDPWVRNPRVLFRLALMVLLVLGAIFFLDDLGFLLTGFVVVFGMLAALGLGPVRAAITATVTVAAVWYGFGTLLHIALPYGVIEDFLFQG